MPSVGNFVPPIGSYTLVPRCRNYLLDFSVVEAQLQTYIFIIRRLSN